MVIHLDETIEVGYYITKELRKQFAKGVRIILEQRQDRVYLITGREGSGKSTVTFQFAHFCCKLMGKEFNLSKICFNSKQFAHIIKNSQRNDVVVFDEAFNGLSSKGAVSKENKELIRLLVECRQRGLIVFIVLPSIFLLEKYIAIFRSHGLINCHISQRNYKHRYYKIYNYKNKKLLYQLGHKYMSYGRPKIRKMYNFFSKFPPTIDINEYEMKKLEAFRKREDTQPERISKQKKQRDFLLYYLNKKDKLKYTELSKMLKEAGYPLTPSHIGEYITEIAEKIPNPNSK